MSRIDQSSEKMPMVRLGLFGEKDEDRLLRCLVHVSEIITPLAKYHATQTGGTSQEIEFRCNGRAFMMKAKLIGKFRLVVLPVGMKQDGFKRFVVAQVKDFVREVHKVDVLGVICQAE